MKAQKIPRWYVSIRSPYSWLALEDAVQEGISLYNEAEMRVFLEPDPKENKGEISERSPRFHYTPMSRAKHLYILRDVARLCGDRELPVTWPIDVQPRWEVSAYPLAAVLAQDQQAGKKLALELARARWLHGKNVSEENAVADCLRSQDLDPKLSTLHRESQGRIIGEGLLRDLDADQAFGVPLFVVGREPYWGLDRLHRADTAHRTACSHSVELPMDRRPSGDQPIDDQPGGCG